MSTNASYTKLRDGSWGIRVPDALRATAGSVVSVKKQSGETKDEIVDRVLWSGQGISLCSIRRSASASGGSSRRSGRSYECGDCGDYVTPGTRRWETGMMH